MRSRLSALVLVAALMASACGGDSTPVDVATAVDVPGPVGVLDTTGGSTFAFEDVVGEPTVLWFWGPG